MLVLRPVESTDLPHLQQLARESLLGVTSLPDDTSLLQAKIDGSLRSFAKDVDERADESYFFVLQDSFSQRLHGCAEIIATIGFKEPFYSLRNRTFISTSRELNIQHAVPALSLCQDLNGHTLLRGFHVDDALVRGPYAELGSRARLLFMAAHPRRFAEAAITEIVGYYSEDMSSPFWDALGKHFTDLPYAEAERLSGLQSREAITLLMPHHPIYIPMLPQAAQDCIGKPHPDGRDAMDMLLREGFEPHSYVDIFDGGPTLYARTANIRSIARSQLLTTVRRAPSGELGRYLLSNDKLRDYRAIVAELEEPLEGKVGLSDDMLEALRLDEGRTVRLIAL